MNLETQYKVRIQHLAWIWLYRNKWEKKEEIENKGKKYQSLLKDADVSETPWIDGEWTACGAKGKTIV